MDEKTTTRGAVLVTGAASGMGRACVLKLADAVLHALTAKVPRTRYPVGHRFRLLPLLARELPTRLLDQVRFRLFGLPRQFGESQ